MVSLRSLQSTSTGNNSTNTSTSAMETSTSSTGTVISTNSMPSSNFKSVSTRKETSTCGEILTTVTTTTTRVSTTSNAGGTTSEICTKGEADDVSITTITTVEAEDGSGPVTTVTTENGGIMTSTVTTKDSATGITTVTTITESDTDMNESVRSTTQIATSTDSLGGVSTTESTTTSKSSNTAGSSAFVGTTESTTTSGTLETGGSLAFIGTTTAGSSTEATKEGAASMTSSDTSTTSTTSTSNTATSSSTGLSFETDTTTGTSSVATSSANNTVNASGTTSESTNVTEGEVVSVSITTITTTEGEDGSAPVTTVTTENAGETTNMAITKDSVTGITTVTTTTETDTDMNGFADSSISRVTTSSGSLGDVERTTTGETSNAEGSSAFVSTTNIGEASNTASSSASVGTTESTSTSETSETTGSSAIVSITTEGSSAAETMVEGISSTTSSDTSTTSATSTSSTATSSLTGSANESPIALDTSVGSSSAAESSTTGTTTAADSTGNSSVTTTTTTSSSTGLEVTTVSTDGSETNSSTKTSTAATSSEGSDNSTKTSTTGSTGSSSTSTSASSSSSSSSTSFSLTSWLTNTFRDEETQLVISSHNSTTSSGDTYQVCDGLPALVTRSSTEMPNGGCPDELTALNASCTCLTGYSETASSWTFRITTDSSTSSTTRSLTQSSSDELAITTFRPIWVSSSLETLVIEGAGESPVTVEFIDENRAASGSSLSLVQSESNSTNISTLSVSNVDLNSVAAQNSDFIPATVTSLTLHNCNISTLSTSFTRDWSWIEYLDLSSNNIDTEFVGGASLKELNLSNNALAVFPSGSLNSSSLQALYLQGNAIKDFNVSQAQFEQIQRLQTFTADQAESSSTCQDGAWQSAHLTTFCVLGANTAAAVIDSSSSVASSSEDDSDGLGLLAYWLLAGAIIVFFLLLLVIWQRRRYDRESECSPIVSPEAVEPTTPKYNADSVFDDTLNRDSIMGTPVAAAAVGAAAYAGYGRSHGNSVDSEDTALGASLASNQVLTSCRLDYSEVTLGRCISRGGFGLVFVGNYRGRQVAVKKIRNERDVEREQVEQFVGEISLISGLNHPRIVEFIGACWTTPAELSAVTELMERGDLRDVTRRFKRRGYRLTWEAHKTVIALNIAEALTYLHGLNPTVIHRDLKAKNVMLNADMEAKLSDFGIARERKFYDGSEHMTCGIGTSFWIAPEVLLGRDYDERADIYSFGVVLSEIDTDDYPYWNAQNPPQGKVQESEILRLVARGAKRPAFSDDCPPTILELAARCLCADPDKRPSASEIVVYLQQLVQDRNPSASFSSIPARSDNSFDSSACSSNSSITAPVNTIVNLRSSDGEIQQSQIIDVDSSTAYAAGKLTKTTTTTTTMTASSSIDSSSSSSSRLTATEALAPSHEVVMSPPQVTHHVVRTNLAKGKRTSTTTTTRRRSEQSSTESRTSGHFIAVRSSDADNSSQRFASDNVEEERRHEDSTVASDHRSHQWSTYEDVVEL